MPQIHVDPAVAANSLRVTEATQAEAAAATPTDGSGGANGVAPMSRGLNQAAIAAALAVPPKQRVAKLFEGIVMFHDKVA